MNYQDFGYWKILLKDLHQDQLSLVIYPADRDFKKLVELQLF